MSPGRQEEIIKGNLFLAAVGSLILMKAASTEKLQS